MDSKNNLIRALRESALEIKSKKNYHWGHMGKCNCGYLAQKLSPLSSGEIHKIAMTGYGDWNEQLRDYCPSSGFPMDRLIFDLLQFGLSCEELANLENLSDPKILLETKKVKSNLQFNDPDDVALYMNTWAFLLEKEIQIVECHQNDNFNSLPISYASAF